MTLILTKIAYRKIRIKIMVQNYLMRTCIKAIKKGTKLRILQRIILKNKKKYKKTMKIEMPKVTPILKVLLQVIE